MSKIITTTDLDSFTGKTLTASISAMVVGAVNDYIEQTTNRSWGETKSITLERYDFKDVIYLRHQDVVSVDAITIGYPGLDTETIPTQNYWVNSLGRLTLLWASIPQSKWGNDLLAISYTYGVLSVPNDLKLAALGIASTFYNFALAGGQNIVSTSVGNYRIENINGVRGAGGTGPNIAGNTAEANYQIIDSYATRKA